MCFSCDWLLSDLWKPHQPSEPGSMEQGTLSTRISRATGSQGDNQMNTCCSGKGRFAASPPCPFFSHSHSLSSPAKHLHGAFMCFSIVNVSCFMTLPSPASTCPWKHDVCMPICVCVSVCTHRLVTDFLNHYPSRLSGCVCNHSGMLLRALKAIKA